MDTEYCTNCKRDIASVNFIMHEVHCKRNIALCKDCNEPVPKSEMEDHFEEYHKPVTCKCGQTVEISQVEEHEKNDCGQRMLRCEFCELELPSVDLQEHVDYCGTRTECCPKCQRYIQMRDQDQHDITNCAFPAQRPPAPTTTQSAGLGGVFDDLDSLDGMMYPMPQYLNAHAGAIFPSGMSSRVTRNVNLSSTIPSAQFYRTSNVSSSKAAEGGGQGKNSESHSRRQRKNQDRVQNIYKNTNQRRPVPSKKKDTIKPSNTDQLEADHLLALRLASENSDDDQTLARQDPDNDLASLLQQDSLPPDVGLISGGMENSEREFLMNGGGVGRGGSPPRRRGNSLNTMPQDFQGFPDDIETDFCGQSDVVVAPCEFCNKTFPLDELILHQSGCQLESLDQVFGPSSPTSVPSNNQHTLLPHHGAPVTHADVPVVDNLRKPNPQRLISPEPSYHFSSEDGSVMLPCEFCGHLLPSEFLPHHQFHCRESRPTRSNQEIESALLDTTHAPPSPTASPPLRPSTRTLPGGGRNNTPPRTRNYRRRQEDVTSQNLLAPSDSDEEVVTDKNVLPRQGSKVKRSLSHTDDLPGARLYGKPLASKNSNRSRQGASSVSEDGARIRKTSKGAGQRVKENDVDDYQRRQQGMNYFGSDYRTSSLPLKSSNRDPRSKPLPKSFTSSDFANENLTSDLPTGHPTTRPLNNKPRPDHHEESFRELLSQYNATDDGIRRAGTGRPAPSMGVKKTNAGRMANNGALPREKGAGRAGTGAGYVPSFPVSDGGSGRPRKTSNSNSVRLAANFSPSVDGVRRKPTGNLPGVEPVISSGISSRANGATNRPPSKIRSKVTRKPSNPPA